MKTHEIETRTSPVGYHATCTCGWFHTERRKQNALARAAKMKAAIRAHYDAVEARRGTVKP